ncbi:phosphotransferase family protein [Burkholderiales bacterium JOSHI_001]|nr:phosphotransferase family protein [Burkholderiales bacterium JOSHI_001]
MSAASLLPADPALPQLAQALDERCMAGVFNEATRAHGLQVKACHLDRVKYRPHRNCTLSYQLKLSQDGGPVFEQRVAARLCSGGESERRHVQALRNPMCASPAGPMLARLPALDMLTWWWPNDAKLQAPQVLVDAQRMRTQVLPAVLAALHRGANELLGHEVDVVQYVPESRLTARVSLQWRADGEPRHTVLFAKASLEPDGQSVHATLRELGHSPAALAGVLRTPRALLWQPEFGLHWQTELPGSPLGERSPEDIARLAPALGAQLAALHGSPLGSGVPVQVDAMHARLLEVSRVLTLALPQHERALKQLAGRLMLGLHWLQGVAPVTLHGDLHPRNILVDAADDDALSLIDLDGAQRGPAVMEFGAWIAEGMYRALLDGAPAHRDAPSWRAMLHGYVSEGGAALFEPALAWSAAWHLMVDRIWRSVVNLKPGRLANVPQLIALADLLADAPDLDLRP